MKRIMTTAGLSLFAGSASASGVDDAINEFVAPIVNPFVGMIFSPSLLSM